VKAILTTRCGCTREMSIPYPPQDEILVPLRTDWSSVWFNEDQPPAIPIGARRFVLHRWDGHSPYGTVEYLEKGDR
jgi:hypothetical protein